MYLVASYYDDSSTGSRSGRCLFLEILLLSVSEIPAFKLP